MEFHNTYHYNRKYSYTGCPEKTERFKLLKNIMLIYATVKH